LKQFQGGVSNTLEQIGIRNDFPNRTQKAQRLKEAMNKWDCIKLKSFCTGVTRLKKQPTEWATIFISYIPDKGLISRIYTEIKNLSPQRIKTPLKKMGS
jgi:hypothetical protein